MAQSPLSFVPDQILAEVFWRLPTPTDAVQLSGVCQRLRHLAISHRNIWKRFRSVKLYCDGDVRIRAADASLIIQFPLTDQSKLRSALKWLFVVCKPDKLHLFIFHDRHFQNRIGALVDALPTDCQLQLRKLKIQLELHRVTVSEKYLYPLPKSPSNVVTKLLLRLAPQSLTHLYLDLQTGPTIKGIFGDWLQKASKLQVLVQGSTGVLPRLSSLPQLKAISFGGRVDTKLFGSNAVNEVSLHHICGSYPTPLIGEWGKQLPQWLRLQITSFCCMEPFNPFDVTSPEQMFPNCRRIEFRGFREDLHPELLYRISSDYRKLQAVIGREKETDVLQIFLHVAPNLKEIAAVERSSLIEIVRCRRSGYNCCALRREFD